MATDPARAQAVFVQAAEISETAARTSFINESCGGDLALKARVEALLSAHDQADSLLDVPLASIPRPSEDSTKAFSPSQTTAGATNVESGEPTDEEPLTFLDPPTRPDSLGRIGHYQVLQVLGKGGFGIVFRAFDDVLHRVVAVKVLSPQLAATSPARKRFLREARSSAQVRHENVVQTYEVGEQPLPYIAMEFIPGETLQQWLDRIGPVEPAEVVRIGRQIAEGLAAAHATDLIHRDIKPGNVLLEGGAQRVKITDFGLARAADDASISQSGIIAGTPMYMAPEQAKGESLDQRADLFSLGSVLYVMAAGRPPFRATGMLAVLKRVAEDTPRPIREIIPETPQWLCDIIAKLHAKNPDDRYQSAREVADVLADCEAQLKTNAKLKDFSRIPKSKQPAAGKSGRWKWVAAAVLVLPVLALAVTESTGVTHLFRGPRATTDAIEPIADSTTAQAADRGIPDSDGWVQLFNGRDLTGWKTHSDQPGNWLVEDGVLIGRGPQQSHLFTERSDYRDFHLRLEYRADNQNTDSGVLFRCGFDVSRLFPPGYEVTLGRDYDGSLYETPPAGNLLIRSVRTAETAHEWRTVDIVAVGPRFTAKINGVVVVDFTHPAPAHQFGHIALQLLHPNRSSFVQFRKIEIKELPPLSRFKNNLGMEFVKVPKGKSWLGGGKDKLGDKEVEIPADFYLGKHHVTQEEWEKVMGYNPSYYSRNGGGRDAVKDITDADLKRFPVETVSWDACQIFVTRLNKLEKETGWVYRLPKEIEWEYACRGGPMSDRLNSAFDFYFAKPTNTAGMQANFNTGTVENPVTLGRTCKVGSYEPNALGLHDLHGNLHVWCDDAMKADDGADGYAIRGGSWNSPTEFCRAGYVITRPPSSQSQSHGLRLARVPSGVPSPEVKTPPVPVVKQAPLPPTYKNTLGMEFVIVPKGKSWLGGGKDRLGDQEVEIPADFYLGKYEVTQEEWEKVMGENPSHFSLTGAGKDAVNDIPDADLKRFPVENVSWDQCQIFVAKLNHREKETGWVYRLPTEVEWEYACRGGATKDKLESAIDFYFAKPTNILLPEQANFGLEMGLNRTCNVGRYEANRLGLFDMHGNVWEWCDDTVKDDRGASARVPRGGSWYSDSTEQCRAVNRHVYPPSNRYADRGLRLARVPSGAS